ncbi:MAG: hypothetical protein EU549_00470 [Promethearchaeota archaeon]|nr:MAG: hypothetical protein EU549_00470 [Candidatus Lokiarchaeota archaeon]
MSSKDSDQNLEYNQMIGYIITRQIEELFKDEPEIVAAAVFDRYTLDCLYQSDNWDIIDEIRKFMVNWHKFRDDIILQGIKYKSLQATNDKLIATNIYDEGSIIAIADELIVVIYIAPEGSPGVLYIPISECFKDILDEILMYKNSL